MRICTADRRARLVVTENGKWSCDGKRVQLFVFRFPLILIDSIIDFLSQVKDFLNPKFLIDYMLNLLGVYVYFGLWFVIFAETGLAAGFFLPGDSMLVVSGLF